MFLLVFFLNYLFHKNKDVMGKMSISTTGFLLKKLQEMKVIQTGVTYM